MNYILIMILALSVSISHAKNIDNTSKENLSTSTKRDFTNRIFSAWVIPANASGQKAIARVKLKDNGSISSISIDSSDPDVKASVERAVRLSAPFPMPSDPDAKAQARSFTTTFTVK